MSLLYESPAATHPSPFEEPRPADTPGEALPAYLGEIGRIPLLSGEAEVDLARAIEAGRAAAERLRTDPSSPTAAEIERLERLAAAGEQARRRLIEANLRLVVSVARRYMNRGMALGDLIQEGNLGLLRAIEKFDHRRGFKFSTYAHWWIRQAITRGLMDRGRTVRLPVHVHVELGRLARMTDQLRHKLGREPTREELAAELGITAEKVDELRRVPLPSLSIDTPMGDEEDTSLTDFVRDEQAEAPEEAGDRLELRLALREAFAVLTAREQRVVELRYGLDEGGDRALSEIGEALGVTRERVRQLEARALRKLRRPALAGWLRDGG